jgi:hypothetical protein
MLSPVALVDQWRAIGSGLPEGWGDARLRLIVDHEAEAGRAAALLGPANPGRHRSVIAFDVSRRGTGPSPELVGPLLARVDAAGIKGSLHLVQVEEPSVAPAPVVGHRRRAVAEQWGEASAALPADWSDVYAELELSSSDYLERAALLLAPVNPARFGDKPTYRFRAARQFGYGASAEMARRCFERLDAEGIRGELRILRVLSDTKPVYTQGPVWYVGGRVV